MRTRIDRIVNDIGERTRSRFTREDAKKMAMRVREISNALNSIERPIIDRLNHLQLKVIALESNGDEYREIAALRTELARLRADVSPAPNAWTATTAIPDTAASTSGGPIYLPAVSHHR